MITRRHCSSVTRGEYAATVSVIVDPAFPGAVGRCLGWTVWFCAADGFRRIAVAHFMAEGNLNVAADRDDAVAEWVEGGTLPANAISCVAGVA